MVLAERGAFSVAVGDVPSPLFAALRAGRLLRRAPLPRDGPVGDPLVDGGVGGTGIGEEQESASILSVDFATAVVGG